MAACEVIKNSNNFKKIKMKNLLLIFFNIGRVKNSITAKIQTLKIEKIKKRKIKN